MARETTALGRRMLLGGILVLVGVSAWRLSDPVPGKVRTQWAGACMGTTWSVKVGEHTPAQNGEAVRIAIEATLERVEARLSTYRKGSDVVRLSEARAGVAVEVSQDATDVLLLAQQISEQTGGAFDVTVAPLVRAWGFGAGADDRPSPPTEAQREALLSRVGYRKLKIDREAEEVTKTADGVEVDLSAIAKGYAVDEVAHMLEARGFEDFLVEVGGELRVRGERAAGEPWRLAIEEPDEAGRAVHRTVVLPKGGGLATSGDYRNYYESGGKRVSHTVDPRTGKAIDTQVASASVVAEDCATADALATAMGVLGAEKGIELADQKGWAVYLLVRSEGKLTPRQSRAFAALTGTAP